jgi:phosphoglycolate phosphatase
MFLHGFGGVLIDLDGTLVDTLDDFVAALNPMLAEFNLPPVDRVIVENAVGKGSEQLVADVLAQRCTTSEAANALFPAAIQAYQKHYATINGQFVTVFPGVKEGVKALYQQGLQLACVTNKPQRFALALLEQLGLAQYFEAVYGGDSFKRKKPYPDPLIGAAAQMNLPPYRVLMVGDSENDVQAARAAGMAVVLVPYGYNHGQPIEQARPDAIFSTLADLARHIVLP